MMRIFRTYFIWLLIPVVMLAAAIIFFPFEAKNEIPGKSITDLVYIKSDKKLNRTMKNWMGDLKTETTKETMGFPGLPIEMFIKENEWEALQNKSNRITFKKYRYDFAIQLNNKTSYLGTYKLRGASSLKRAYKAGTPDRLCYNIKLFKSIRFTPDVKLKKFYLMNMIYDPYYFKMRFAYTLLQRIGLFSAYHQFVTLTVNGAPQGIYLLVERPQDAAVRGKKGVIGVYRRRNPEEGQPVFETKYQRPQQKEKWHIHRLYKTIHAFEGEALISELRALMDLDAYLRWMAFNSLTTSGDTQDELYYVIVQSHDFPEGRIEFLAWDYDDIFDRDLPEEELAGPLFFTCEDEIDKAVQRDPALYTLYQTILIELLYKTMTPAYLQRELQNIEAEGNALSTGLPEEVEIQLKQKRRIEINRFRAKLLARHAELTQRLKSN